MGKQNPTNPCQNSSIFEGGGGGVGEEWGGMGIQCTNQTELISNPPQAQISVAVHRLRIL